MFTNLKQEIIFAVYGNFTDENIQSALHEPLLEGFKLRFIAKQDNEKKFNTFLKEAPYEAIFSEENEEVYEQALLATNAFFIVGKVENPVDGMANYMAISSLLHSLVLDPDTVAIVDGSLAKMYSRQAWMKDIGEPLIQGEFDVQHHIEVDCIPQDDGYYWMKTRGLIMFGKPEISIHDISDDLIEAYLNLLNIIAGEMIINNYLPQDKQEIILSEQRTGIFAHHAGSYDDDEYWGNVHIELQPT